MTIAAQLIDSFARIVRADGGQLTLLAEQEGRIELGYAPGHDPECADGACVLPHVELQEMMSEWLSRRAPGTAVVVRLMQNSRPGAAQQEKPA
jgi:hypothetical protein